MGGLKRKIDTKKKIERKDPRAVTFSKRRKGLYSKASELCLRSDAQIAIIATPVSSNSNAPFYSFGHSSVDSVVAAFLADQTPRPRDDHEKLGFWWEDESLDNSESPEDLGDAIVSMRKMLHDLKELQNNQRDRVEKETDVSLATHHQQTLNPESCSSGLCVQDDDVTLNYEGFHNNTGEQTLAVSGYNSGLLGSFDGCDLDDDFDIDQIYDFLKNSEFASMDDDVSFDSGSGSHVTHQKETQIPQPCSSSLCVEDDLTGNVQGFLTNTEHFQGFLKNTEHFEGFLNNTDEEQTLDPQPFSSSLFVADDLTVNVQGFLNNTEHFEGFLNNTDEEQPLAISGYNNGLLGSFVRSDQLFDFETRSEAFFDEI